MKRTNQKRVLKNTKISVWNVVVLATVMLFLLALWKVPHYTDQRRFSKVEKTQSVLADRLAAHFGDSVSRKSKSNICFNTEEGPYDNGNLWCQTATVVYLKEDVDFMELGNKFVEVSVADGLDARSSVSFGVSDFWFDVDSKPPNSMSCELGYYSMSGEEHGAGTRDILFGVQPPAFAIACADRAKAKHYPYVD